MTTRYWDAGEGGDGQWVYVEDEPTYTPTVTQTSSGGETTTEVVQVTGTATYVDGSTVQTVRSSYDEIIPSSQPVTDEQLAQEVATIPILGVLGLDQNIDGDLSQVGFSDWLDAFKDALEWTSIGPLFRAIPDSGDSKELVAPFGNFFQSLDTVGKVAIVGGAVVLVSQLKGIIR